MGHHGHADGRTFFWGRRKPGGGALLGRPPPACDDRSRAPAGRQGNRHQRGSDRRSRPDSAAAVGRTGQARKTRGGLSTVGCSVSDDALWLTWVCRVRRAGAGGAVGCGRGAGNVRCSWLGVRAGWVAGRGGGVRWWQAPVRPGSVGGAAGVAPWVTRGGLASRGTGARQGPGALRSEGNGTQAPACTNCGMRRRKLTGAGVVGAESRSAPDCKRRSGIWDRALRDFIRSWAGQREGPLLGFPRFKKREVPGTCSGFPTGVGAARGAL